MFKRRKGRQNCDIGIKTHIKNTKVETPTSETHDDGNRTFTYQQQQSHSVFFFFSFFYSKYFISVATIQSLPFPRHDNGYLLPEPGEPNWEV